MRVLILTMKITPAQNFYNIQKNLNFKGAALCVNGFSDSHGSLENLDIFYEDIKTNRDKLFLENKKGNQNLLTIAGDWFISGNTTGYMPNEQNDKKVNSHFFQIKFFNTFIYKIQEMCGNLKTFFIPGNHEFDAGEDEFKRVADSIDAKIIMTNLDFENSPTLKDEIDSNKIVQKEIIEIEDDKNPNLKHKVLSLGISTINMPYYSKNLTGIKFIDQHFKAEKFVEPKDYEKTLAKTVSLIEEFKKENPKGLVIVNCHTGANFAKNLAEKTGENISLIFDGHEHKDEIRDINGVPVVSLSQNFKKYVNAKFLLDDNGDLKDDVKLTSYYPFKNPKTGGFFRGFLKGIFINDLKKDYQIKTEIPNIEVLGIENVRTKNSYLANFITDSILSEIQSQHPDVQIFGINASAIRGSLETETAGGTNNLQALGVLNGITHQDAKLYKNKVSGKVLMDLVLDNLLFNEPSPERCPLIHYSGLIIDKKAILAEYHSGKKPEELMKYVTIQKTGKPLDPDKNYTITNVKKYFVKSKNPLISEELAQKAEAMDLNAKDLFVKHMQDNKDNLYARCDNRILD